MNRSIKHITILFIGIGVVTTPTFAFESTISSEINSPPRRLTELEKIAEQVRGWNAQEDEETESADSTSSDELVEEHAPIEESQEIKKLDSVFFDYVMATYIARVRRS